MTPGAELPLDDASIRAALLERIRHPKRARPGALVIEELGLRRGTARVDVAVVGTDLRGFEIKSDRDTLARLPVQAWIYGEVLDLVTLVVGRHHAEKAQAQVPAWWGVLVAERGRAGAVRFCAVRRARRNRALNAIAVAELLWRDEALEALRVRGLDRGVRSKGGEVLRARLAAAVGLDELRETVRRALLARSAWRKPWTRA